MPMINKEHKDRLFSFLFYVMNVYEQQSSYNPNMPVRQLMYVGKLYDKYIHVNNLNIYGKKAVSLPVPKLVTFYNGTEGEEDKILRLSDSFDPERTDMESDIEVKVRMININHEKNTELMKACKPLEEYAWLVERIRRNRASGMEIGDAVDKAIDNMPGDYVIRTFLVGNRAEVKDMCITEYNEAETMKMFREEGREEGEDKLGKLVSLLIRKGRTGDAQKAAVNKEERAKLYKEFNIV